MLLVSKLIQQVLLAPVPLAQQGIPQFGQRGGQLFVDKVAPVVGRKKGEGSAFKEGDKTTEQGGDGLREVAFEIAITRGRQIIWQHEQGGLVIGKAWRQFGGHYCFGRR